MLNTDSSSPSLDGKVAVVTGGSRRAMGRQNNQSFSALSQALNCDVLLDHDMCFNPFAVNPNVLDPYTNPQNVADSIFPTQALRAVINTDIFTMDLIFNGTVPMHSVLSLVAQTSVKDGVLKSNCAQFYTKSPNIQTNTELPPNIH